MTHTSKYDSSMNWFEIGILELNYLDSKKFETKILAEYCFKKALEKKAHLSENSVFSAFLVIVEYELQNIIKRSAFFLKKMKSTVNIEEAEKKIRCGINFKDFSAIIKTFEKDFYEDKKKNNKTREREREL